jgi:hypothetical protein
MTGSRDVPPNQYATSARLAICLVSLCCGSCAFSYTDQSGTHHVIGLVAVDTRPAGTDSPLAGDIVSITSIGVAAGSNAQGGYLAFGYSRQTTAALRDDIVVRGDPVAALEHDGMR